METDYSPREAEATGFPVGLGEHSLYMQPAPISSTAGTFQSRKLVSFTEQPPLRKPLGTPSSVSSHPGGQELFSVELSWKVPCWHSFQKLHFPFCMVCLLLSKTPDPLTSTLERYNPKLLLTQEQSCLIYGH